ncbi:unnamed protein product [Effrenium voratum]|uniref:Uncharacterized protein n=1 Tax=Effrenium voratum TaxID=2562239 RepID=A0AA36MP90_9DINO|nr:unnamed protein product [Effrenium voratum]CAJ1457990.1 unnamed protein product [Effrenium voratum]
MEAEGRNQLRTKTPPSRQTSNDDLDEFQTYQRFRLKLVSMFGSMAAGLYEFGADPQTGRISQKDFVRVCVKLELMNDREATSLFQHFTNADPWADQGCDFATFKDFSIDEEEWNFVVASKQQARSAKSNSIPFSSAPSGISTGLYHRPMCVQVLEGRESPKSGPSKRIPPWREPQKPWAPSMLAGTGMASIEAKTVLCFRPNGQTMVTKGKTPLDRPRVSTHEDTHSRSCEWRSQAWRCPTRRDEMEPLVSAKQVAEWWPYRSPAPAPKAKLRKPKL